MRCAKTQRLILERDPGELDVEVTAHVEACPDCGRRYQAACACRELVGLKRYEQPNDLRRQACLALLHERLAALPAPASGVPLQLHPAVRYGLAAVVLVLAGAHLAAMNGAPPLRSPVTQSDLHSRSFEQFLAESPFWVTGGSLPAPLFETFATFPSNRPAAPPRPRSVFFVGDGPGP